MLGGAATRHPLPDVWINERVARRVLEGTLVEENGCLLVEAGGSRWLVLWPGSARTVESDAGLVVRDGTNEAVVGEPIRLGGGEYGMNNYDFVVDLIDEEVPPACRESEQFWL
ncbi:MAG: hypothetical protein M3473_04005, partial [Chloroflexota bacterium]|nr:hypothetical protein [Chloroflexota bacterium]